MLISHTELVEEVVGKGYIEGVQPENINGSSIDIVLGDKILVEEIPEGRCPNCQSNANPFPDETKFHILHPWACHCGFLGKIVDFIEPVDFAKKQPLRMKEVDITDGFLLMPGQACLAHSVEKFHLPMHITAEYRLKSSQARVFLEHLHAGWCDPGWHGSVLTLEFVNLARFHPLILRAGDKCGQATFYKHDPVPEENSYAVKGQYNGDESVSQSKGAK